MKKLFDIVFLDEAFEYLKSLDPKHYKKVLYNIRLTQYNIDSELFKKLNDEIWEFRTLFQGKQHRLLAFWDKSESENTLVIATHGFVKKRSKVPENEIGKAINIKKKYFDEKNS